MNDVTICWVVTSEIEAKIVAHELELSRVLGETKYMVFADHSQTIWLIVSGFGQTNTAEATNYLYRLSNAPKWALWVHLGFAFSSKEKRGETFIVDKIIQSSTGFVFYTGVIIKPQMPRASLLTLDSHTLRNSEAELVDRQAAGFMHVASEVAYREFTIVVKFVLDDLKILKGKLNTPELSEIMAKKFNLILKHINKILELSKLEKKSSVDSECFLSILDNWKFTESQTHQLRELMRRWTARKFSINALEVVKGFKTSRDVIFYLRKTLEEHDIDWNKD